MKWHNGFTLIELVAVLVLVGILVAVAAPRLLGNNDARAVTVRDQLLSRLRLVQTMNMNEPPSQRTQLAVEQGRFAHRTQYIDDVPAPAPDADITDGSAGWRRAVNTGIPILLNGIQDFSLIFDRRGRPLAYNRNGGAINACQSGCRLTLGNRAEQSIIIESEGYIHAP